MSRAALVMVSVLACAPAPAAADEAGAPDAAARRLETGFPAGDGRIVLYAYHLGEVLETTYRRGDRYDPAGLAEISRVFRSRTDGKTHPVDPRLVDLLDHLQDRFGADCIEIISGYRSPALNARLREAGGGAAEHSMHVEGRAADIHIDEVTEEVVAAYVRGLGFGGVGYYPALDFVHLDTGPVRNWDMPDRPGRLLMAMRKGAVWQVTTDRDLYLPGEPVPYEILNITRTPKARESAPRLEIFRRGTWRPLRTLKDPGEATLGPGETWTGTWAPSKEDSFGKFRIVIPAPEGFDHLDARSNEFYRKRR